MTDLLPAEEVLKNLESLGMTIELQSVVTGKPISEIKSILKSKRFIPEDAQIASAMRQLAWRVWAKSMDILESGHPDQQMAIMRIVLGRTAGLIGEESDTSLEEQKEAITRILSENRTIDVTASDIQSIPAPKGDDDYVEPPPSFGRVNDPGQEPEIDEDPIRPAAQQNWR